MDDGATCSKVVAVEPVALAMISPSALTRVTNPPLTDTDNSIMRESAALVKTTSFRTMRVSNTSTVPVRDGLEHRAFVQRGRAAKHALHRRQELVDTNLREKTEAPEVHAKNGDVAPRTGDARRHREQRAVASQYDDHVDVVGQQIARRRARALRSRSPPRVAVSVSYTASTPRARSHAPSCETCSDAATRPFLATMPTRLTFMGASAGGIRRCPSVR